MDNNIWKALAQKSLSEDDFTKPGEMIPRDAGFGDFIKYNVAHINPQDLALQMGMMSGGIKNMPGLKGIYVAPQYDKIGAMKDYSARIPVGKSTSLEQVEAKAMKNYEGTPSYIAKDEAGNLIDSTAPDYKYQKQNPTHQIYEDSSGAPVVHAYDMGNYTQLVPERSLLNLESVWKNIDAGPKRSVMAGEHNWKNGKK